MLHRMISPNSIARPLARRSMFLPRPHARLNQSFTTSLLNKSKVANLTTRVDSRLSLASSRLASNRAARKATEKQSASAKKVTDATTATEAPRPFLGLSRNAWLGIGGGTVGLITAIQFFWGKQEDFFDYRFVIDNDPEKGILLVDPDDLSSFYGGESFMELFCVLPFMQRLMMRGGYFDDEGVTHTQGLPGELLVSMVFSDGDDEEEQDDGNNVTPWFNKRERFKNVCWGYTCWDMVTNFGFYTLPDGKIVVYHHGEYFKGSLPPISLFVNLVFIIHARWVAFATKQHLLYFAFPSNEIEEEEHREEESRSVAPFFMIKNYKWTSLLSTLLFGSELEPPAKIIRSPAIVDDEDDDEEEKEEEKVETSEKEQEIVLNQEEPKGKAQEETVLPATQAQESMKDIMSKPLPAQTAEMRVIIDQDIAIDRELHKTIQEESLALAKEEGMILGHENVATSSPILQRALTKRLEVLSAEQQEAPSQLKRTKTKRSSKNDDATTTTGDVERDAFMAAYHMARHRYLTRRETRRMSRRKSTRSLVAIPDNNDINKNDDPVGKDTK